MEVKVVLFARARELANTSETVLQLPIGSTSDSLVHRLLTEYPGLKAGVMLRAGAADRSLSLTAAGDPGQHRVEPELGIPQAGGGSHPEAGR